MELNDITPLILTYNEADNIRDTISRLEWAREIVVVDSFSTDQTLKILTEFKNVRIHQHHFVHFADQCNFGLSLINSRWVLSLDADYRCPESLHVELATLSSQVSGYRALFRYCVFGKPLRGTLYPSRCILYQKSAAVYERDGHAHRVKIDGTIGVLNSVILHDDRKPFRVWCSAQVGYASAESDKLSGESKGLDWKDRIRQYYILSPPLTLIYCLFWLLLILDGWPGIYYTFQRVFAELLLSLTMIDQKLRRNSRILTDAKKDDAD